MNERIRQLAEQAGSTHKQSLGVYQFYESELQVFAELIVQNYAQQLVQADMSNPEYSRAMDAYYNQKWAHRLG
jgi:hypothetical protein